MDAVISQNKTQSRPDSFGKISLKKRAGILFSNISKHEIFLLAGSLACTTAFSIAPIIYTTVTFLISYEFTSNLWGKETHEQLRQQAQ